MRASAITSSRASAVVFRLVCRFCSRVSWRCARLSSSSSRYTPLTRIQFHSLRLLTSDSLLLSCGSTRLRH
ncbi:hypothetical protein D3C78_1846050 [compost metagenome]